MITPTRRGFLGFLAAPAAFLKCGRVVAAASKPHDLAASLDRAIGDPGLLAALRRCCRESGRRLTDAEEFASLQSAFRRASQHGESLDAWLSARMAQDFAAARIARVEGWVISRTEYLLFRYATV